MDAEEVRDRVGGWSVGHRRKSKLNHPSVRSKCSTVVGVGHYEREKGTIALAFWVILRCNAG